MIRKLTTMVFMISLLTKAHLNSFSQSLSLSDSAGPIAPNSVLFQSGDPFHGAFNTHVSVTNTSGSTIEVKCKKTEIGMIDSTLAFICWAGICYNPAVYVSTHTWPILPGQTYDGFKGTYYQANHAPYATGESKIRWTWFNAAGPEDSVSVTVIYSTLPVRLDGKMPLGQGRSRIAPNPADRYIHLYADPSIQAPFEVHLCNTTGRILRKYHFPVVGNPVILDVSGIEKGLSFLLILRDNIPQEVIKASILPR